jgi:hypothetical protein
MSKIAFRNYDKQAIKALLKEMGKDRYECALRDVGLSDMKPMGLTGFFIEWNDMEVRLYHRYPSGTELFIVDVLGFWAVPNEGWVRVRV